MASSVWPCASTTQRSDLCASGLFGTRRRTFSNAARAAARSPRCNALTPCAYSAFACVGASALGAKPVCASAAPCETAPKMRVKATASAKFLIDRSRDGRSMLSKMDWAVRQNVNTRLVRYPQGARFQSDPHATMPAARLRRFAPRRNLIFRKLHRPHNSLPFLHINKLIRLDVFHFFYRPPWPANLQHINIFSFSNRAVHPQIVLRKIAAATAHFIDLRMRFCLPGRMSNTTQSRADAAAV